MPNGFSSRLSDQWEQGAMVIATIEQHQSLFPLRCLQALKASLQIGRCNRDVGRIETPQEANKVSIEGIELDRKINGSVFYLHRHR